MKLNFNKPAKNVDGSILEGEKRSLGKMISDILMVKNSEVDVLKAYGWATKLSANEALEIDISDYDILYKFLDKTDIAIPLVKAQCLIIMREAKEASEKKNTK